MWNRGWIRAGELRPGDHLIGTDGLTLCLVERTTRTAKVSTFNLEIAEWHTYFVASEAHGVGVWVHNNSTRQSGPLRNRPGEHTPEGRHVEPHGRDRMQQRGFTEEDVDGILDDPGAARYAGESPGWTYVEDSAGNRVVLDAHGQVMSVQGPETIPGPKGGPDRVPNVRNDGMTLPYVGEHYGE